MDYASNGFVLICAALVFIMTPGLAFFYGGLARKKNVLDTMMASIGIMGTSVVLWVCFGYSLSFGNGGAVNPVIGGFENSFFIGLSPYTSMDGTDGTISVVTYAIFQMMFAMITPAVVTGAGVGRMTWKGSFLFTMIWSILSYYPLAHMVWGGGFMNAMGINDFAGGVPIEVNTGISGLVLAAMLGRREGFGKKNFEPHNKPYVFLGAAILWIGWIGFNAGSSYHADGLAAHAALTTMIIASTAILSWGLIDVCKTGKPTLVGASSALVCGLVAATPSCGYIPVWAAFVIGAAVSPVCYFVTAAVAKRGVVDDPMSVFGCHGMAGIVGCIGLALFASQAANPATIGNGLVFGDVRQFGIQMLCMGIGAAWAAGATAISFLITKLCVKVRVDREEEVKGLDLGEHGEDAYPAFSYVTED